MKKIFEAVILVLALALMGCGPGKTDGPGGSTGGGATGKKVALDFHVMSKCPYGVKVMQAITPVLDKIGDRIDFNVHYIGRDNNGEPESMHGKPEVDGNILQLCAKNQGDNNAWLAFMKCQNEDWRKIPEGWEDCAKSAKVDVDKMKSCYEGPEGKNLLLASFSASQAKRATGSPTIFLGGERYQGGRSETAFIRKICSVMEAPKADYCNSIPAPVSVPVTVVGDARCKGRGCDARGFLAFVSRTCEGSEVKQLDYADAEGKALFEKSGQKFLPIAVFGPTLEKDEACYSRLKPRLAKLEGSEDLVFPLGRQWDPTAEVCDDKVDNTGNGKVDCDDATCEGQKVCRKEIKNKLDLFVMSQCPYGAIAGKAMDEVLKNFKKDPKKIDFTLNFIGNEVGGKLTSMHGQAEVDEDIRQACAQKLYPKNYKFMDYVNCRNEDYRNPAWETCAKDGISAAAIKKCAEGEEGKALLAASFKKASDLGIGGSPTWLLNNKHDMRARDSESIKKAFCQQNEGVAGCENTLTAGPAPGTPAPPAGGGCGPTGSK